MERLNMDDIKEIRILPMGKNYFKNEKMVIDFLSEELIQDEGHYHFPTKFNFIGKTLILFQYDNGLIASGIITDIVEGDFGNFNGYYVFDKESIIIFNKKIDSDCLKKYYPEFNSFNQSKQKIDLKYLPEIQEMIKIFSNNLNWKSIKRNLIFFGAPGTGKSYNLNECKNMLLECEFKENYERVTFHPDYSYSNFVGTYKPVPKTDNNGNDLDDITYKYVPGPFIRSLVNALKHPEEPFLLIIEEINRANVAAVFGDVFQLLDRDKNNISEYSINISEDMKSYLKKELSISEISDDLKNSIKEHWYDLLGKDYCKITIPSNMFIWATMNSADQGVFPIDTAFKRRWDFKYFDINHNENELKNIKINLNNKEFTWNKIRKAINKELISYGINEDKLMGPFFAFKNLDENLPKKDLKKEFKEIFKNKIIMYLFEDVARANRKKLFKGSFGEKDYVTYFKICEDFDNKELKIFSKHIRDNLKLGE